MKKCTFFWVVLVILAFQAGMLTNAQADAVGNLTQVEGRVDMLRGGKLPAIGVKLNDGVQMGDVIRTKSQSKAQITFIDDSLLTLSQNARMAIEDFKFDSSQGKRQALLNIAKGLALVVVNKILQTQEPDFLIKTQTAITGVRGTEFGIINEPNSSTILNYKGRLQVGTISPQVSRLFLKASKVAFGPPTGDSAAVGPSVTLGDMQKVIADNGMPIKGPLTITPEEWQNFILKVSGYKTVQENNQALTFEDKEKLVLSILGDDLFREYAQATTDEARKRVLAKFLGYAISNNAANPVLRDMAGPPGSQNTANNLNITSIPPQVVPTAQVPPPTPTPEPTPAPVHQSPQGFVSSP